MGNKCKLSYRIEMEYDGNDGGIDEVESKIFVDTGDGDGFREINLSKFSLDLDLENKKLSIIQKRSLESLD